MYRYENFLYTVEMTGQQIKDFLQYSANYYMLENNQIVANPEMAGYNYDMAEGINYTIKVRRNEYQDIKDKKLKTEVRKRKSKFRNAVSDLVLIKTAKALEMDKKYTVAMNSYRASGGGGHLAAAGITNPTILSKSNMEMRTILGDYFRKLKIIEAHCDRNWKTVIENQEP